MTTATIESIANRESLAGADWNVGRELREKVIPKFLLDVAEIVGKTSWLRKRASISVVASSTDRDYDLPANFDRMDGNARLSTAAGTEYQLKYIGEDAEAVNRMEASTEQARPTGFDILTGETNAWAVRFNTYPDDAYTMRYVYYYRIPFTDYTTSVDMDDYIPAQFQYALVHALRAEILGDRFGIDDPRYGKERQDYQEFVSRMKGHKEFAARSHAVFVN
jgi:hypothetical protein